MVSESGLARRVRRAGALQLSITVRFPLFNEMELALFRQRSLESRMAMAQRGELFATLPAGYEKVDRNRIERTADQRQRDAIHLVFRKFRALGSIRQVFFWFHRNTVELPVRTPGQGLVWRVPTSSRRVAQILTNPIYAGAYAYGRRRQETVIDNGRKRVRRGIAKQDPSARNGVSPSSSTRRARPSLPKGRSRTLAASPPCSAGQG